MTMADLRTKRDKKAEETREKNGIPMNRHGRRKARAMRIESDAFPKAGR